MNEHAKKTHAGFNGFDLLLVILAALIIVAGVIFFFYRSGSQTETTPIRYTVLVKDLPKDMNVALEEGQNVVDTVRLYEIGTVSSYKIIPAEYDIYSEESGELIHGTFDDLLSVYVTIDGDAVVTEEAYTVGGQSVSIGSILYFRTPTFVGYGYITELVENPAS